MNAIKNLFSSLRIYALSALATRLVTFLILPICSRFLTVSDYGTYDYLYNLSILLTPVIALSMERAVYRFLFDGTSDRKRYTVITNSLAILTFNTTIGIITFITLRAIFFQSLPVVLLFYSISIMYFNFWAESCRGMNQIESK